jgi:hypothetical protein
VTQAQAAHPWVGHTLPQLQSSSLPTPMSCVKQRS